MNQSDPARKMIPPTPMIGLEPLLNPTRLHDHARVEAQPYFTLWDCIYKGGCLRMLGRKMDIKAGTLILIPAGIQAHLQAKDRASDIAEMQFAVRVSGRLLKDAAEYINSRQLAVTVPGIPTLALIAPSKPGMFGDRFLRVARFHEDPALQQIEMMWHLASALRFLGSAHIRKLGHASSTPNVAHLAANFLYQRSSDPSVTLEDVATFVGVSKSQLTRLFRKEYQTSPMRMLREERMARARQILESPDFTVNEIAELVGYSSREFFSRTFKAEHGVSPREYRHSLKPRRDPYGDRFDIA